MRAITFRAAGFWLVFAAVLSGALVGAAGTSAQALSSHDGTTQATAAASCWEAKQIDRSARSGVYWILTPQLQAPTRIHCDMTTDGGGWELIGRGRDGWSYDYNGRGTSEQVAGTISGVGAFSPRQLDSHLINGLLGGRRFDSFADGVRLRRAANAAGTSWQEIGFTYKSRDRWTWALGAGIPIASFRIDGATGSNSSTYDFGTNSSTRRVWTSESAVNGWVRGFNYGSSVTGSTSSTSHLYSKASGGAYATPFTQVFIRPTLRTGDLDFAAIPDSGTTKHTIRPVPRNGALAATWGVTGTGAAGTGENATEVQAFAQIGNTMYVGGNFTTVQKGADASGADTVAQPYLAAFNATTGEVVRSFVPPRLNNQVKSLAALPGGRLAVGGEFTTVNGSARAGLVVLDAASGALSPSWTTDVDNRLKGGRVSVRALDTDGTHLYVGGAFTHFVRGSSTVYAQGGARLDLGTGVADPDWNPQFNGTATALDVSDDGRRVYFAGYFTTSRGVKADRAAAISTSSGAARIRPLWQPTFSTSGSARYQQAIQQVGDTVWLGGSQHSMFGYDTSTFALVNAHITRSGGDIQSIAQGNGLVYGGCHCEDWNYSDTSDYDAVSIGDSTVAWSQADRIYYLGVWDARSGDFAQEFSAQMRARNGMGVWAIKVASDGTVWAGGSLRSAVKENGANQWVGGFARFAVRPHTAPSAPADLAVTTAGDEATVTWSASATSGVTYEVLRNDRVVATTSSLRTTVAGSAPGDRFFVRAVDGWDNRSASTRAVRAAVAPVTTALIPAGAVWFHHFDSTSPVAGRWQTEDIASLGWPSGPAPLGWGIGPITTDIDVPAGMTRALTSYYRRTFTIASMTGLETVRLTTRADDGVAVHVNGTEVGRANLPEGPLTPTTYAITARNTATAIAGEVTFDVPLSLLHAGVNSIAVEVHSNYRLTPSSSMDLRLVATS